MGKRWISYLGWIPTINDSELLEIFIGSQQSSVSIVIKKDQWPQTAYDCIGTGGHGHHIDNCKNTGMGGYEGVHAKIT